MCVVEQTTGVFGFIQFPFAQTHTRMVSQEDREFIAAIRKEVEDGLARGMRDPHVNEALSQRLQRRPSILHCQVIESINESRNSPESQMAHQRSRKRIRTQSLPHFHSTEEGKDAQQQALVELIQEHQQAQTQKPEGKGVHWDDNLPGETTHAAEEYMLNPLVDDAFQITEALSKEMENDHKEAADHDAGDGCEVASADMPPELWCIRQARLLIAGETDQELTSVPTDPLLLIRSLRRLKAPMARFSIAQLTAHVQHKSIAADREKEDEQLLDDNLQANSALAVYLQVEGIQNELAKVYRRQPARKTRVTGSQSEASYPHSSITTKRLPAECGFKIPEQLHWRGGGSPLMDFEEARTEKVCDYSWSSDDEDEDEEERKQKLLATYLRIDQGIRYEEWRHSSTGIRDTASLSRRSSRLSDYDSPTPCHSSLGPSPAPFTLRCSPFRCSPASLTPGSSICPSRVASALSTAPELEPSTAAPESEAENQKYASPSSSQEKKVEEGKAGNNENKEKNTGANAIALLKGQKKKPSARRPARKAKGKK